MNWHYLWQHKSLTALGSCHLCPTSIPAVHPGNLLAVECLQLSNLSPCFSIKLLKSMRSVTQRPKLFQQCNTVFLQFHNMSKMLQDTWLVAVKTNIQILYYVTGAQEFCCNLKLCNFLITSSAFMQHHYAHIPICSHLWSHFSFHTQHVTKHCIYKTCTNTISLLPFCYITEHHNYAQCTTVVLLLDVQQALPFKNYMQYSEWDFK